MSLTYIAGHQLLYCRHSSAGYCTACVTILWRPFRFRSSDSCSAAFYHPHWQSSSQKIGIQAPRLPASLTLVIFSAEKGTEEGQQVDCLNRNTPGKQNASASLWQQHQWLSCSLSIISLGRWMLLPASRALPIRPMISATILLSLAF